MNSCNQQTTHEAGLLPVSTLVLWCACAGVSLTGLLWPDNHQRSTPLVKPMDAEIMTIEPTEQQLSSAKPSAAPATPPNESAPPQPPAIAPPSPSVAFTEPVNAPAHAVESPPIQESRTNSPRIDATRPALIRLTYGEGEGEQPAPQYPVEAVIAGEEGTVVVRFAVNEDGRVTDAVTQVPCRWPVLNYAAAHAIRETWRFGKGPPRSYEVSIQFQLNRHE